MARFVSLSRNYSNYRKPACRLLLYLSHGPPSQPSQRGSTLIESTIAAAISALFLGSLFTLNSSTMETVKIARETACASQLLQQRIEAMRSLIGTKLPTRTGSRTTSSTPTRPVPRTQKPLRNLTLSPTQRFRGCDPADAWQRHGPNHQQQFVASD